MSRRAVLRRALPPPGAAGSELRKPAPEAVPQMWPVSRRVNRVGNDGGPTLIDEI